MSRSMCTEVRDLAPELALGIVGGPERAEALQHASECGPCRALVGELAEAADALPLLVAEAAAAATIVSIVGVRVVESVQETNRIVTAASDVRSAQMNGANGLDVGNVFVSNGTPSSVVVNVNYWVPSGNYGIEFRNGSTDKRLGDVSIHDGRGTWGGVAALPGGAAGS